MKIVSKDIVAEYENVRITKLEVIAPIMSKKALPGQFVILMVSEEGERIPLTIANTNPDKKTITIIFQEVGYSTKLLGRLEKGDSLFSLVGPLGHPTPIKNYGKVIIVAGGVGIAEVLPITHSLKKVGNKITTILGAKTKSLVILQDELRECSDELLIATDDGTLGSKGFVTDVLSSVLAKEKDFGLVYCVGPVPMMQEVSEITRPNGIKTLVCLNAIMLDGTGMCGTCRLREGDKIKFCCVDGPDFDGHKVDFGELMHRQNRFLAEEKTILKHKCKCKDG